MSDKIELLSQAGNFETLAAAVNNGADAVYFGSKLFNARRLADKFTTEELKKAIEEKERHLRTLEEKIAEDAARQRRKLEEEFTMRSQAAKDQLAGAEETIRRSYEEKLKAEVTRVTEHLRITEAGLAAQRDMLGKQAAELEAVAGRRPMLVSGVSGEGVAALLRAAWAEVKKTRGALAGESDIDQTSGWQP